MTVPWFPSVMCNVKFMSTVHDPAAVVITLVLALMGGIVLQWSVFFI